MESWNSQSQDKINCGFLKLVAQKNKTNLGFQSSHEQKYVRILEVTEQVDCGAVEFQKLGFQNEYRIINCGALALLEAKICSSGHDGGRTNQFRGSRVSSMETQETGT